MIQWSEHVTITASSNEEWLEQLRLLLWMRKEVNDGN